jgi:hypothetical protein
LPCPVLQYADDALIIIRAIPGHVATLKALLDNFSAATGLTINFHKSTFSPSKRIVLMPLPWPQLLAVLFLPSHKPILACPSRLINSVSPILPQSFQSVT